MCLPPSCMVISCCVPRFWVSTMLHNKTSPSVRFLADEIRETARLTRFLAQAASHAIQTLHEKPGENATRLAIDNLMLALQSQDRIEQRLSRLADYTRQLEPSGFAEIASETAKHSLVLDELVNAFARRTNDPGLLRQDPKTARRPPQDDDVELF